MSESRDLAPIWLLVGMLTYTVLACAVGAVWEPEHDEAFTHVVSTGSIPSDIRPPGPAVEVYDAIEAGDPDWTAADVVSACKATGLYSPPAYFLLLHWWTGVFGAGQFAMRAPAYLIGLLTLFGIYRLGRRLFHGSGVACAAMMLLSLSPYFHALSNFARPYCLLFCIAIWSTYVVHRLESERQLRWLAAFVALSILGLYTVYHYAFVLAWHGISLLVAGYRSPSDRRWRERAALAVGCAVIGIGFGPWIRTFLRHSSHLDTSYVAGLIPVARWPSELLVLIENTVLVGGLRFSWPDLGVVLLWILCAITLLLRYWPRPRQPRRSQLRRSQLRRPRRGTATNPFATVLLWSFLFVPGLIAAGDVANDTHSLFLTKTNPTLLAICLVLIALACTRAASKVAGRVVLSCWLVLFGVSVADHLRTENLHVGMFDSVAVHDPMFNHPDHLVIFSQVQVGALYPMLMSLRNQHVDRIHVALAPGANVIPLLDSVVRESKYRVVTVVALDLPYLRAWDDEVRVRLTESVNWAKLRGWTIAAGRDEGYAAAKDRKAKVVIFLTGSM